MSAKLKFLTVLLVISSWSFAQEQESKPEPMEIIGFVVNSINKEPITANITYESLPYGDIVGIFKGSNFTFRIEDGSDYSIRVNAQGFDTHNGVIKNEWEKGNKIQKVVIELLPSGTKKEQIIRLEELIFAVRSDVITEKSHDELDEIVAMLSTNKAMKIQLEGHTDWQGNPKQNLKLSERRVNAVKNYIVDKGISKKRIKTKAYGGTQPLSRARDAESRKKNRRVEVRILTN
ncbi:MAG: OmpA family protein [Bacteroidota bacterium]